MLRRSRQNRMSFHSELYAMIPENHLLKKIDAVVDFCFIFDLVEESYCLNFGRPANEPEVLFRLLFIQYLYNLSDERVVSEAQVNLAYKWFLGLNPEDPIPDSSQLSRFRNHRLGAGQVDDVLLGIVRQCVDKGLIKSKALIVDSTHTLAASQRQKPLDVLNEAAKKLYRVVVKRHSKLEKRLPRLPHTQDPAEREKSLLRYLADLGETVESLLPDHEGAITEKLKIAKQIVEDERLLANKGIRSAVDPEARFGWKSSKLCFFGYKEHLAMTEEEIITAVEVTAGNEDDGKQLPKLLEKTLKAEVGVEQLLGDTAYSGKENLKELGEKNIQTIVPLNPIVHEGSSKQQGFSYNKDADVMICPAGQASTRKAIQGSKEKGYSRSKVFYFNTEKCRQCPLREGCYKSGAKVKTYSVRLVAEHYQEQLEFEATTLFRERSKRRRIIEHKNAELKRHHGMAQARYRGLARMRLQAILTAVVANAKRMVKLIEEKYGPPRQEASRIFLFQYDQVFRKWTS